MSNERIWSVHLAFEDEIRSMKEDGTFDEEVAEFIESSGGVHKQEYAEKVVTDGIWEGWSHGDDLEGWIDDLTWNTDVDSQVVMAQAEALLSESPFGTLVWNEDTLTLRLEEPKYV